MTQNIFRWWDPPVGKFAVRSRSDLKKKKLDFVRVFWLWKIFGQCDPPWAFMPDSGPLGLGNSISIICVLAAEEATSHWALVSSHFGFLMGGCYYTGLGAAILFCSSTVLLGIADDMDIRLPFCFMALLQISSSIAWATCDLLVISFLLGLIQFFQSEWTCFVFASIVTHPDMSSMNTLGVKVGLTIEVVFLFFCTWKVHVSTFWQARLEGSDFAWWHITGQTSDMRLNSC